MINGKTKENKLCTENVKRNLDTIIMVSYIIAVLILTVQNMQQRWRYFILYYN